MMTTPPSLISQFWGYKEEEKLDRFPIYKEQLDLLLNSIYYMRDLKLDKCEKVYEVPRLLPPPYDKTECAHYLLKALKEHGFFAISLNDQRQIFISWDPLLLQRVETEKEKALQRQRKKERLARLASIPAPPPEQGPYIELSGSDPDLENRLKLSRFLLENR